MSSRNSGPGGMLLVNLDATTRRFMKAEFDADLKDGKMYISDRLTPAGKTAYSVMLREAIEQHGIEWLVSALAPYRTAEELRDGIIVKTPVSAMRSLAEAEFNHYYMRGVCQRALSEGIDKVVAYRARDAVNPRLRSQAMRGKEIGVEELLTALRERKADSKFGVPGGPNSGMSVRLP